jgi:hypothetical protein
MYRHALELHLKAINRAGARAGTSRAPVTSAPHL